MIHISTKNEDKIYNNWYKKHIKNIEIFPTNKYKFSIILLCDENEISKNTFVSINNLNYKNYELLIVNTKHISQNKYQTIKNAINDAKGDYVCFVKNGDCMHRSTLSIIEKSIIENSDAKLLYTDEDQFNKINSFEKPIFKPNWSLNYFLDSFYIGQIVFFKSSILKEVALNITEHKKTNYFYFELTYLFLLDKCNDKSIVHIPIPLYHSKRDFGDSKLSCFYNNDKIDYKKQVLESHGFKLNVDKHFSHIYYQTKSEPLVSIIIPSKDNFDMLKNCINSILNISVYKNIEIIVIDNGSANKDEIKNYLANKSIIYIYFQSTFNYSKMCNMGIKNANGKYCLFLNDDIEIIDKNWLNIMVGQAEQPKNGAVGIKLYYPDSQKIQHAGVINRIGGPCHEFYRKNDKKPYYLSMNWRNFDCLCTTGACMLVSKKILTEIAGFDENFPITYNDVDLCFRIHDAGYINVQRNDIIAIHHESISRGLDAKNVAKEIRLKNEMKMLFNKHPNYKGVDPYLNKNITNITKLNFHCAILKKRRIYNFARKIYRLLFR